MVNIYTCLPAVALPAAARLNMTSNRSWVFSEHGCLADALNHVAKVILDRALMLPRHHPAQNDELEGRSTMR